MNEFKNLTALIIDPQASMRGNFHNMLNLCNITAIDHAVSSGTAIKRLRSKAYDIILCEYDLVEGQDGQQLLEDLRFHKIIPLWTIYIMVTAERSHEKVISAAELQPTVYLLKPFTADTLLERLRRAIERRVTLMPVYKLIEQGNLVEAVRVCEAGESTNVRFAGDFMRLKAELQVSRGQTKDAEAVYAQLAESGMGWARLGLAKTYFAQERYVEAEGILTALVAENSKFLDAYDWLARTHEALGKASEAKAVLENAVSISPHVVRRLRKLGEVSLETGDVETAERSFQQVVAKAKYSEFRDPEDHVRLVKTLVTKGDTQNALATIRDMDRSLGNLPKTQACSAFSAAMVHEAAGEAERAAEKLQIAVVACRDSGGVSSDMKLALAKSCLDNNLEEVASEVMLDVMNNAPDKTAMAKAVGIFEQAGRKDLAETLADQSRREVSELVSSGAKKAKEGDYIGAVELMTKAATKMPDNPQVIFNAAVALLKCLDNLGWNSRLGEQARWYIDNARRIDAANPKLIPLDELYFSVLKKYEISPSQIEARSVLHE